MKYSIIIILIFYSFLNPSKAQDFIPMCSPETGFITDLVLLYQGDKPDIQYTEGNIKPYVYIKDKNNKFRWLFDSFLFLSGRHPNGKVFDGTWGSMPATQKEWKWIIDELFKENRCFNAIESVVDSLTLEGESYIRKKKVVVSIPQPILNQKDWGSVNGMPLDFTLEEDRLIAAKWFIDEVLFIYNQNSYKHIDLVGFYYFKENNRDDVDLITEIGKYIKEKDLKYYWIPYLWAPGYDKAKDYGFDVAYQQPNYFFKKSNLAPETRMDLVLNHAKDHNMGVEMEFNKNIQYIFYQTRFMDYIKRFEEYGVWGNASIGYYQDFETFKDMSTSEHLIISKLYDKLCNIIVRRQNKSDSIFVVNNY